jgi:protein ImuB
MLQQQELFEPERTRQAPQHLAVLVDRLSSRLGRDAVLRPCLLHDAQPEYACVYVPLAGEKAASGHAGVPPSGRRRGGPAKGGTATTSSRSKTAARRARVAGGGDMRLPHERPLSLLPRPVPLEVMALAPQGAPVQFRLAQKNQRDAGPAHRVARSWGPERIETGWWRSGLIRRDYYRVETTQGERYWLFHELASGVWYLQGEFA